MKKIEKIIYSFFAGLMLFAMRSGLYRWWSLAYRWLYQHRFLSVKLNTNLEPEEAQKKMNTLIWRRDGAKEVWDSMGSPNWVQHCINEVAAGRNQPAGALDCDDYASWACHAIDPVYEPMIFSISWHPIIHRSETTKYVTGHAVCIFKRDGQYWHCGNWGTFGPWQSLHDVGSHISGARKRTGMPISWAILNKNIKVIDSGYGLPAQQKLTRLL